MKRKLKRSENDENRSRQQKFCTYRGQGSKGTVRQRPTTDGRPTVSDGVISRFLQDLFSWIQELETLIQDFDLQLCDSKDKLGRHYSQGFLELKKKEQSRATNWGLTGAID
ncbi:hypothetical protein M9H77_22680 [Catharanthus roseus]|uniref:Uncharacterized protein n=1 Tax=Catharanthus roseus TaxID=4058 RepID=A0ACC0AQR8_CATRO|nr:hypothetical protein M9H77_22680 [Catharanthus roseus]